VFVGGTGVAVGGSGVLVASCGCACAIEVSSVLTSRVAVGSGVCHTGVAAVPQAAVKNTASKHNPVQKIERETVRIIGKNDPFAAGEDNLCLVCEAVNKFIA